MSYTPSMYVCMQLELITPCKAEHEQWMLGKILDHTSNKSSSGSAGKSLSSSALLSTSDLRASTRFLYL